MLENAPNNELSDDAKYNLILLELRKLGDYSQKAFNEKSYVVKRKENGDEVTDVDEKNDAEIRSVISKYFPNDGLITEEGERKAGTSGYDWIVDPLDGTKNFIRGNHNWHITISRIKSGKPLFTTILSPTINADWSEFVYQNGQATEGGKLIPTQPDKEYKTLKNVQVQIRTPYERDVGFDVLNAASNFTQQLSFECGREPINSRDEVSAALTIAHGGPQEALVILPGATAKYHDVVHGFGFVEAIGGVISTLKGNPVTEESYAAEGLIIARNAKLLELLKARLRPDISEYINSYQSVLKSTRLQMQMFE